MLAVEAAEPGWSAAAGKSPLGAAAPSGGREAFRATAPGASLSAGAGEIIGSGALSADASSGPGSFGAAAVTREQTAALRAGSDEGASKFVRTPTADAPSAPAGSPTAVGAAGADLAAVVVAACGYSLVNCDYFSLSAGASRMDTLREGDDAVVGSAAGGAAVPSLP